MSSASLAIKNAQMPMFKQAKAEGKIAFFRHTKLITREKADRQRQKSARNVPGGGICGDNDITLECHVSGGVLQAVTSDVAPGVCYAPYLFDGEVQLEVVKYPARILRDRFIYFVMGETRPC
ncbi:hypothetical protein Pcinc_023761 [Petrolisthes cinctipes]|uniref:Uncharacterized protein n=1 Tax=Petrolisthes cinctipes TaxID=88211 RepID=A0AAE1FCZ7_PETCI|nr:hypothetical protein Pcinc_023761 [Petrolisthes cinctipes]